MEEEKQEKENERKEKQNNTNYWDPVDLPKEPPSVYKQDGELRVCNQGRYEFYLDEDVLKTGIMSFELKIPKYLDTSQINVDLNPQYVRVEVKGKVTQLKFSNEIIVEKAVIQRSTTTGFLLVKAPILEFRKEKVVNVDRELLKPFENKLNRENEKDRVEVKRKEKEVRTKIYEKPKKSLVSLVSYNDFEGKNLVNNIEVVKDTDLEREFKEKMLIEEHNDIDLSEIPDLD